MDKKTSVAIDRGEFSPDKTMDILAGYVYPDSSIEPYDVFRDDQLTEETAIIGGLERTEE